MLRPLTTIRTLASCFLASGVLAGTTGPVRAAGDAAPDSAASEAVAVARALRAALGGEPAWERARFFRFDWVVERGGQEVARARHLWDRWRGRARIEWRVKDGKQAQVVLDTCISPSRASG